MNHLASSSLQSIRTSDELNKEMLPANSGHRKVKPINEVGRC
jgi:hypothetical protein